MSTERRLNGVEQLERKDLLAVLTDVASVGICGGSGDFGDEQTSLSPCPSGDWQTSFAATAWICTGGRGGQGCDQTSVSPGGSDGDDQTSLLQGPGSAGGDDQLSGPT